MASVIYPKAKEAFLNKLIDMDTDDIRCVLIDTADYTYASTHDFLDDVAGAARVATMGSAMSGRTITNGVFDADDVTFTTPTGDPCEAIIIYLHTGSDATARLIAYIDGISITPDGANNVVVQWDNGANKIFAL